MTPHWLFPKGALTHIVLLIFICFVGLLLVLFGAVPGISRRRACRGNAEHDDRGAGQKETAVHEHGNLPHIQGGVASGDAIVGISPPPQCDLGHIIREANCASILKSKHGGMHMTPHWLFPKGALTHIVLLIFICFVGLLLVL